MKVLPSVDLMSGKVVRLVKGDPSRSKVYSTDPVETAGRWKKEGASMLHIVDLDAALEQGSNLPIVEAIITAVDIDVEVGGGVRTVQGASRLLDSGVEKVVLGTAALRDKRIVSELISKYGGTRVMVALDYLGDRVMVRGWKEASKTLTEALSEMTDIGARRFLLTDVGRDGTLQGPDLQTLTEVSKSLRGEVVASGGVRGLEDLVALQKTGVAGVVIGTALYEGLFTLRDAVRIVAN